MRTESEGKILRIYVGESDRWEGRPLYEAIVRAAREQGLAGATALRGIEGFGASSRIHTVKVLRLSEDLPIVVEIIDRSERIAVFIPTIDTMVREGLVTLETVDMFVYRQELSADASADEELQLETAASELAATARSRKRTLEASETARETVAEAKQIAAASRRAFVDSVDVMLSLLRDRESIAGRAIANLRIDVTALERALREAVNRDDQSSLFLKSLEAKCRAEAKWLNDEQFGPQHLLLALCQIRPSAATDILMRHGAQPRDLCKNLLQILGHQEAWQRWLADRPDM
jgi:PII-like signaling protein